MEEVNFSLIASFFKKMYTRYFFEIIVEVIVVNYVSLANFIGTVACLSLLTN